MFSDRFSLIKFFRVAGAANVSADLFFFLSMLGNIELYVDTTNNHLALMSYFASPLLKTVLLEIPLTL